MLASTLVLALVIVFVGGLRGGRAPGWLAALAIALLISVVGILFGKYGENFGLPWWIYYTAPMLATVLFPHRTDWLDVVHGALGSLAGLAQITSEAFNTAPPPPRAPAPQTPPRSPGGGSVPRA